MLVAFGILALAIGPILQVLGDGMRAVSVAESYATATFIAQSKLEGLGIERPLEEGVDAGFVGGFRWETSIRRHRQGEEPGAEEEQMVPFDVTVRVEWGSGDRSVTLSTLRLGTAPEER